MAFVPFEMERYQSTFEHHVDINLSESGVHPLTVSGLCDLIGLDRASIGNVALEYIQSNGSQALRELVAAFHPGASTGDVVITNGSAEANFIAAWELVEPGDEIVFMEPNYFQVHGLAANLGATVSEWWLDPETWTPRLEMLDTIVTPRTRLIVVTSPNNPTGTRFEEAFVEAVVAAAGRTGAWILADEVYRGAELDGRESISFAGRYDRVVVTGGLSKAYALPGLRLGWAVAPAATAANLWARKDYTTISPGAISQFLAERALTDAGRAAVLGRTRGILRENWSILEAWLNLRRDIFRWRPPAAGAIAFVAYDLPIDAFELCERVRTEVSCLLVPGTQFRVPNCLRIGFGPPPELLSDGLERLGRIIDPLRNA